MPTTNIPVSEAGGRVADIMLRGPRTLSPEATVAEARRAFDNPRERLLLVTRDGEFVGAIGREALAPEVPADAPVEGLVEQGPRVAPEDPVAHALELLEAGGGERLPVVAADGSLVGLVCFNPRQRVFCIDARDA